MSEKTYTAEEVAYKVLAKVQEVANLNKALFNESIKMESSSKSEPTKSDVFYDIKWCLEKIKTLKELSWTVEQEAPAAKEIFEKEFSKEKSKLNALVKKYNDFKKGEESSEELETIQKAEKVVGEDWTVKPTPKQPGKPATKEDKACFGKNCKPMAKADGEADNKLQIFLDNKKAKKANKMEKMLGVNSKAKADGQALAPQITNPESK